LRWESIGAHFDNAAFPDRVLLDVEEEEPIGGVEDR
jgi:hypothetical protein